MFKETYETYVDLMCRLDSKSVSAFLRSKSSSFRPDVVLRIVTKHEIKVRNFKVNSKSKVNIPSFQAQFVTKIFLKLIPIDKGLKF